MNRIWLITNIVIWGVMATVLLVLGAIIPPEMELPPATEFRYTATGVGIGIIALLATIISAYFMASRVNQRLDTIESKIDEVRNEKKIVLPIAQIIAYVIERVTTKRRLKNE